MSQKPGSMQVGLTSDAMLGGSLNFEDGGPYDYLVRIGTMDSPMLKIEIELDIRGSLDWATINRHGSDSPTSSGAILRSISLQDREGEGLGSAADAVLARTADLLAIPATPVDAG
eukprot:scaffold21506_cov29-Prasinocladus_malaysianus.AAC.1